MRGSLLDTKHIAFQQLVMSESPTAVTSNPSKVALDPDAKRLESFGRALDALRKEVEDKLGTEDVVHIQRVSKWSAALEITGRGLIHFSFEPLGFSLGVAALSAHKALELMELGHMALHGCYDKIPGAEAYHADHFKWKAPIDETSWHRGHNIRHHQYTNIAGRDPDLNFGIYRLSSRIPFRRLHRGQPVSNLVSWLWFTTAINAHVTGIIELVAPHGEAHVLREKTPETVRTAQRAFFSKMLRYYGREYVFFPLLAGPFFWKTLLGNAMSEMARDVYAAATIYCGHVGAVDYPENAHAKGRAQWYKMQAEGARDFAVPPVVSVLCGALDRQIEHHLFPRLPPNRLREIAPRVKAICEAHGVRYLEKDWPTTLREVLRDLRNMASPAASPLSAVI
jgi:fatty acid desaturase